MAAEAPARPLAGWGILVTRPTGQEAGLCARIAELGGRPEWFPGVEVLPNPGDETTARVLEGLAQADLALFISTNAVRFGLEALPDGLPPGLQVGAVGQSTAQALNERGIEVQIRPETRFDSEGLLALPTLADMEGRRVVIFRGSGGRPLLGDELAARGAEVHYAEVYRRTLPRLDPVPLREAWGQRIDLVTATSTEILENLFRLFDEGCGYLHRTPVLVISERMARRAVALGCAEVILAQAADDASVAAALVDWVLVHPRHAGSR